MPYHGPGQHGFTIIELVITLTVASILLVMAVSSGRNLIYDNRFSAIAVDLVSGLGFARNQAMKLNRDVRFQPVPDAKHGPLGGGWIVWTDTNDNGALDDGEKLLVHEGLHPAQTSTAGGVAGAIVFLPDGSTGNGMMADYRICDDRKGETGRKITVLVSGRIRSENYGCD